MLSPDYLYNVSDRAIELYEQLNTFAVKDICRRLVNADWQFTGSIDWQLYKLQQSGMVMDDIVAEVAKLTKKSNKEIAGIFEVATYKSQVYDNAVYRAAGLTPIDIMQSPQMLNILQATYRNTMGELMNFTQTTSSVGQSIYMNAMDEAYFKVISGQQSYIEAVRQAVNKIASNGLFIHYPSGYKETIETAVRRCVITGVSQATAKVSLQNAQNMDTDLVLVSAHLGARPSHAEWQGKVYSISGMSKKYRKLTEVTGYGTVSGLCGANCRHHFMPYIDGISHNPYEHYNSKENEEYYNKQQEQRKQERNIRSTKRELKALKDSIDATKDDKLKFAFQQDYDRRKAKLKHQTTTYREFCKQTGLRSQQERLQVSGWGSESGARVKEATKGYHQSLHSTAKSISIDDVHNLKGINSNISDDVINKIGEVLNENNALISYDEIAIVDIASSGDRTIVFNTVTTQVGNWCSNKLEVNKFALSGKNVNDIDKMFKNTDVTACNSLEDAIIHEIYHAKLADKLSYPVYNRLCNTEGIKGVSQTSLFDLSESISEIGVKKHQGKFENLSEEAKRLFQQYFKE